jgi:hypothetical protein
MQIEHKKNTAYYLAFPMVDDATPANFKTGVSPVDTAYYKDGAGAWTSLAITDTASEIGSTGVYEIDLTAAEMNHDQVIIKFAVSGAADTAFVFDMRTKLVSDLNDLAQSSILSDATPFAGADVAAILTDTGEIGAAGAGLSAIPWNASWDAQVESECTDALNAYDPPTKTEMDLRTLDSSAYATAAKQTDIETDTQDIQSKIGTPVALDAGAATLGAMLVKMADDNAGADFDATTDSLQAIRDRGDAAWVTGSGGDATAANQTTIITHLTDVKGTGFAKDTHSLPQCLTATGFSTHTAADVRTEIDSNSTQLALIVADTNELQTDWVNGGRLDLIIDAILADTNELQTNQGNWVTATGFATAAALATHDGKLDTVDSNVDAILADTGTDGVVVASISDGAIGAAAVADMFSTATVAEAYAADGAAGTVAQLLYEILQSVSEFAISGTTKTVRKRDGSTTAATYTLDDANTPTSITRAT